MLQLNLYKRLVGYNEEILDMKFLGDDEQYLAVATNLEQVNFWIGSFKFDDPINTCIQHTDQSASILVFFSLIIILAWL